MSTYCITPQKLARPRRFFKGKIIMGKTIKTANDQQKIQVKIIEVKMIKSGSMILTLIILTFCFKHFGITTGHSH
jgi:hypothetical protein